MEYLLGAFGLGVFLMIAYQCTGFTKQIHVKTTDEARSLIRKKYGADCNGFTSCGQGFYIKGSDDVYYCFLDSAGSDKKYGLYFLYYKTHSDAKAYDVCDIGMALTGPF
jgi:hypothetical protein